MFCPLTSGVVLQNYAPVGICFHRAFLRWSLLRKLPFQYRQSKDKHPRVTRASVPGDWDLAGGSGPQLPAAPFSLGGPPPAVPPGAPPAARAARSALFPSCPARAAAVPRAAAPPRGTEHRRAPPPAQAAGPHIRVPTPAAQTLALWSWRRGRQC